MPELLVHWYAYSEVYAILLAWIVLPLGFYAAYLFLKNHYGIFALQESQNDGEDEGH